MPLTGWRRELLLDETDLPWVAPSPNCQNLDAALCYTGMCVFEGSNLSEGRGTTIPFQIAGAPFVDGLKLEKEMNALGLPGLHFRSTAFCPTFSKHQGALCRGVQMHITDRDACDAALGGLLVPDRSFSPMENRLLTAAPAFSPAALLDGKWTDSLESYLQDQ